MRKLLNLSLAAAVTLACSGAPELSDTGYVGIWSRGSDDRAVSTIAIVRDGEAYRFKWNVDTADGSRSVRCGWDGRCEETVDGAKTIDYTFRTWTDPETGHLFVECRGRGVRPERDVQIHYVSELMVDDGGLSLLAHERERDGKSHPEEVSRLRVFEKRSNEPGYEKPSL